MGKINSGFLDALQTLFMYLEEYLEVFGVARYPSAVNGLRGDTKGRLQGKYEDVSTH